MLFFTRELLQLLSASQTELILSATGGSNISKPREAEETSKYYQKMTSETNQTILGSFLMISQAEDMLEQKI